MGAQRGRRRQKYHLLGLIVAAWVAASCEDNCRRTKIDVAPIPPQKRQTEPDTSFGCGHQITCGTAAYRLEIRNIVTLVTESFYGGLLSFECSTRQDDAVVQEAQWFESQASRTEAEICAEDSALQRAAVRCGWPDSLRDAPDEEGCRTPAARYWIEAVAAERDEPDDVHDENFVLTLPVDLDSEHRRCGAQLFAFQYQEPGITDGCKSSFQLLYDATANGLQHGSLDKRSSCLGVPVRLWYSVTSAKGAN